jgi:hypothetical protein
VSLSKGFDIGSEVGFFEAFARVWIGILEAQSGVAGDRKDDKVKRELNKLASLASAASNQVPIRPSTIFPILQIFVKIFLTDMCSFLTNL